MPFWTYMLLCADGHYYTGHTDNLEQRLADHQGGRDPRSWTYTRRPVSLVWAEQFATRAEALDAEVRVGGWSRRKKEALIGGDWETLSLFSRPPGRRGPRP